MLIRLGGYGAAQVIHDLKVSLINHGMVWKRPRKLYPLSMRQWKFTHFVLIRGTKDVGYSLDLFLVSEQKKHKALFFTESYHVLQSIRFPKKNGDVDLAVILLDWMRCRY